MKHLITFVTIMTMISIFAASGTLAQQGKRGQGGGGWGAGSAYARMYDPKTVEMLRGEVLSVDQFTPVQGRHYGIHAVLKTDQETISVHLGPGWYIENQDITIAPKDQIEVTGSRVTFEGKPALIAAEVKKGNAVFTLRDANGVPMWSGWRRQ
jgi:hypothetical protein